MKDAKVATTWELKMPHLLALLGPHVPLLMAASLQKNVLKRRERKCRSFRGARTNKTRRALKQKRGRNETFPAHKSPPPATSGVTSGVC